jgi:hypothetical protein
MPLIFKVASTVLIEAVPKVFARGSNAEGYADTSGVW